jgi:hypothetical protein
MQSLRELQRGFAAALMAGDEHPLHECIIGTRELDASAALAVYRNNVFSNYRKGLREDYPALLALVGESFFHGVCDAYARTHGSNSGDLNDFGAAFARFLEQWSPAQQLPYLPDVARLEWAIHLALNAADVPALELTRLAQVSPEDVSQLRFGLHPSAALVSSPYPVFKIWHMSAEHARTDECVDLDAGADRLLVIRRNATVEIEPVALGEWTLLQALADARNLADAHALAAAADPAFDLGTCLQRHVLARTIVSFHQPQDR